MYMYVQALKPHTFFMIPDFLFENVVYLLNLFCMYCISIFTRPLVFFPAGSCPTLWSFSLLSCRLQLSSLSLVLIDDRSSLSVECILEGWGNWEREAKGSVVVIEWVVLSPSILEVNSSSRASTSELRSINLL